MLYLSFRHDYVMYQQRHPVITTSNYTTMKKLLIVSAVALLLGLIMPQTIKATVPVTDETTAVEEAQYTEINVADLPEAISKAIAEDYAGYTVDKAFQGNDGTYKIKISSSAEKLVLFYNEEGEFLKVEKV
jgi:hypothetical protein